MGWLDTAASDTGETGGIASLAVVCETKGPARKRQLDVGGKTMKSSALTRTLLFAVGMLAVAALAPDLWAQARQCSNQAVAGEYGFTLSGLVILPTGPVPIAAVGRAALDEAGNASGSESRSVGGGFAEETLTGTYTLNPDCTGEATLNFYESGQLVRTSVVAFVFDNNEREFRMVQKSLQLPNGVFLPVVITVEARRTFTAAAN